MNLPKVCLIHNQSFLTFQSEIIDLKNIEFCLMCLENGLIQTELITEQIKEKKKELIVKTQSCSMMNVLLKLQNEIQKLNIFDLKQEKIFQLIEDHIKFLSIENQVLNELKGQIFLSSLIIAEIKCKEYKQRNDQIRLELIKWLQDKKLNLQVDNLEALLNQTNEQTAECNQKQYEYLPISKYYLKNGTKLICSSFAFNKNVTILYAGQSNGNIQVYGFNSGKKLIQTLQSHTNAVLCLIWMKKFNQLLSGSFDKSIIMWSNQVHPFTRKYNCTGRMNCMILNENENLLIMTTFLDNTITFLKNTNLNWSCQQVLNTDFFPFGLSLSPSQTKLISCGQGGQIIVVELDLHNSWVVTQIISLIHPSYKLCFLSDYQFVLQTFKKDLLRIFLYNQELHNFIETNQFQVQFCDFCVKTSSLQYIDSKNIFIVKNEENINFFGIDQNQHLILKFSQQFDDKCQNGGLSENRQFLVTYSSKAQNIQVRKLQYYE